MRNGVIRTAGNDSIAIPGVGTFNQMFYSGVKAVPVTLDVVIIVPGFGGDLSSLKPCGRTGKYSVGGDGTISLLDEEPNIPLYGGLYRQVGYRATRKLLQHDGRLPR